MFPKSRLYVTTNAHIFPVGRAYRMVIVVGNMDVFCNSSIITNLNAVNGIYDTPTSDFRIVTHDNFPPALGIQYAPHPYLFTDDNVFWRRAVNKRDGTGPSTKVIILVLAYGSHFL